MEMDAQMELKFIRLSIEPIGLKRQKCLFWSAVLVVWNAPTEKTRKCSNMQTRGPGGWLGIHEKLRDENVPSARFLASQWGRRFNCVRECCFRRSSFLKMDFKMPFKASWRRGDYRLITVMMNEPICHGHNWTFIIFACRIRYAPPNCCSQLF
jgi:hypothetical protein